MVKRLDMTPICSNFSCTPATLAVGLRPGAWRAMGLDFACSSPPFSRRVDLRARSVTQAIHQQFNHLSRICGLFAVSSVAEVRLLVASRRLP